MAAPSRGAGGSRSAATPPPLSCRPERLAAAETAHFSPLAEKRRTGTGAEIVLAQNVLSSSGQEAISADLCNPFAYAPLFSAVAYFKDPDDKYVTLRAGSRSEKFLQHLPRPPRAPERSSSLLLRGMGTRPPLLAVRRLTGSSASTSEEGLRRYNSSNLTCRSRDWSIST